MMTEDVGKTFRPVVAWSQYQTETSYQIFQQTITNFNYLYGQFCLPASRYLNQIQSQVTLTPSYIQQPLRINDKAIMDHENTLSHFTTVHHRKINCVWIHLGVTCLSEIITLNGESLM